ncbi:hypothetical protein L1987_01078 [Smallanthus sonchifolius]|uniref:Uncharacterized protein n=1 Tax=Smallanthus sonchifolius TaxID=185202 RepID=A0ACB9K432_9ASTR|nr:hypothetical protein L1987_01078 [Smallanthus sonchifolius]
MQVGLADEIAQGIQEEENDAAKREEAERKLEEYFISSPQRKLSTPSSSRKKSLAKKSRKARIISWTHMSRSLGVDRFNESESSRILIEALKQRCFTGYEPKKVEEESLEVIPIISWELLSKTEQFIITYQNGVQKYLSADKIVTLVLDDLRALLKIPLKNE